LTYIPLYGVIIALITCVYYVFIEKKGETGDFIKKIKKGLSQKFKEYKQLPKLRKYLSREYRGYVSEHMAQQYVQQGYTLLKTDNIEVPLIIDNGWIPQEPIPSHKIKLEFTEDKPPLPFKWDRLSNRLKREINSNLFDAMTYRLLKIERNATLKFIFCHGSYFDYVETCEAYAWDLARALDSAINRSKSRKTFPAILKDIYQTDIDASLELRNKISNILDLKNRSAAVGVVVLTVISDLMNEGAAKFLVQRRGSHVTEAVNTVSVVPGGTFQPFHINDLYRIFEFDFNYTILREFGEEILNKSSLEPTNLTGLHPFAPFESDQELTNLRILFQSDDVKRYYMGIGIDTVTLKPELMMLLLINGQRLVKAIPRMKSMIQGNWEGTIQPEKFTRQKLNEYLELPETVAVAKGCMALALKHFDWIQKELENLTLYP